MSSFKYRRLEKWKTSGSGDVFEVGVPLPTSELGLVLRMCPNEQCQPRRFQLGPAPDGAEAESFDPAHQRRPPRQATCTCPYCGEEADDSAFVAPEDVEAAIEKVKWAFAEDVGDWLDSLARDFNRNMNRGGKNFLGIKMTSSRRPNPEPRPWREDLLRVIECNWCARQYGVYAIGSFCPDCGAANLKRHFEREVTLVIGQVDIAEQIAEEGTNELAFRILGNAHEDVVTGFETYLKSTFRLVLAQRAGAKDLFTPRELRGNPFQNLERAERLFRELGVALFSGLDEASLARLHLDFEKRHVVGHNLGLADEKYAEVVEDAAIGETVPLLGTEIEQFARTCLTVIGELEAAIPELRPPR